MDQHLERLISVHPIVAVPVREILARVEKTLGMKLLIVRGGESIEKQMEKFRKGRAIDPETKKLVVVNKKFVVTNAAPGKTAHNVEDIDRNLRAMAVDLVPLDDQGMARWKMLRKEWEPVWEIVADCGLDPLGDEWGAHLAYDLGHVEEPGWKLKLDVLALRLPTIPAAMARVIA
jgi:hypothetical protein